MIDVFFPKLILNFIKRAHSSQVLLYHSQVDCSMLEFLSVVQCKPNTFSNSHFFLNKLSRIWIYWNIISHISPFVNDRCYCTSWCILNNTDFLGYFVKNNNNNKQITSTLDVDVIYLIINKFSWKVHIMLVYYVYVLIH